MQYAKGACQCKKVQFEVAMPPSWVGHCHCHQCQQIHGAAFVTWIGFRTADYKIIDPKNLFKIYNSGKADRGFCSSCGSSFYFKRNKKSDASDWKDFVYFTRTNIITNLGLEPQEHIFYGSRVSWISISDNLPKKDTV